MGNLLYKIGKTSFQNKWRFIATWIVVIALLAVAAINFAKPPSTSVSIPGTSAQMNLDRFKQLFPETGASSGNVVLSVSGGKTIEDYRDQITLLKDKLTKVPEVTAVTSPFDNPAAVSKDKTVAYLTVQIKPKDTLISADSAKQIQDIIAASRTNNLTIESTGDVIHQEAAEIIGPGEISGLILALVVLLITFGSLVSAGLPLLTAIVTVAVSMAGLFSLSHLITIDSTTPSLAVMLGLAVGIDYSLFIINRYRTFLKEGYKPAESAGKAIATAGNAVIFAAATVVIALAALSVVQIPFMTTMGLASAGAVATAAIISITLVPALLGIVGLRIFGKKTRKQIIARQENGHTVQENVSHSSVWYRIGETILKHRKVLFILAVLLLVVVALPVRSLNLGLGTAETAPTNTTERRAYDTLSNAFGAGFNGPLLLLVEKLPATSETDKTAVRTKLMDTYNAQMSAATASQKQAALTKIEAEVEKLAPYYQLSLVAERIAKVDNVESATPILTTQNGTIGAIQVVPHTGPSDTATKNLVSYFRNTSNQELLTKNSSVTIGVTGTTAAQLDINDKLAKALPVYLATVIGLSLILLIVAFRSILVPIKATLGFLLSVLAMFGALVAVFQWGWFGIAVAPGPIVSFIPIISIGILFGLAMDYEFFLVSSMQEAYHRSKDAQQAILRGYGLGSRVVIAAGLIMISVFSGFITNHDATIQAIGFALTVGILVDAFIVRLLIVPIIMSFLGDKAWWLPKWLDKRLPNISIEGKE
jgi:RND superfamily putative drug exporter